MKGRSLLLLNQTWLAAEFQSLGWDVHTVGLGDYGFDVCCEKPGISYTEILERIAPGFRPDAVIYYDNSSTPWMSGLSEIAAPSIFYSVDAHHHHSWHPILSGIFDFTFVAQPDYLTYFHQAGISAQWLPLWAPRILEPAAEKEIDVSFRGNMGDPGSGRARFFDELSQIAPGDYGSGDYADPYQRSKIVVNQTVASDVNFRIFEGMMAGALMLTPDIPSNGFPELFQPGVDLVTYKRDDAQDAAQKLRHYLSHPEELAAIASRGREKILSLHTGMCRAVTIDATLRQLSIRSKPTKYLCSARVIHGTSVMLRRQDQDSMNRCLFDAAAALERSAEGNEGCSSDFVSTMFILLYCLEEVGLCSRAEELLLKVRSAYQDDVILALAHMERLLKTGDSEGAHTVAKTISHSPEELIAAASMLLENVRQDIQVALDNWEKVARP